MSSRTIVLAKRARLAVAFAVVLLGCDRVRGGFREAGRDVAIRRLLDSPGWRVATGSSPLPPIALVEICGEARPGLVVDDGVTLESETTLPSTPSWLDVEAAVLPFEGETAPPPRARLTIELQMGDRVVPLFDAFPSPGTPPTAFGFGRARVDLEQFLDLVRDSSESPAGPAVFRFRVASEGPAAGTAPARKVVLANPRISPRVGASPPPSSRIDFWCRGPDRDELATDDGRRRWPAFAAFAGNTGEGASWTDEDPLSWAGPDETTETARFGPLPAAAFENARALDAVFLADPYSSSSRDAWSRAHAGWDEALLRDRLRALGERWLFRELARPRAARLALVLATDAEGAELDDALARLLAHLRANDLLDLAELSIHVVRGEFADTSFVPAGFWSRAARPGT